MSREDSFSGQASRTGKPVNVAVIGCGAAGMMAAVAAAESGARVTVFEKNDKPGKKLFITGKGRCNVTTAVETQLFFDGVVSNPRFLYSAVYGFDNTEVISYFTERGCPLVRERGDRMFPESGKSSDIIKVLTTDMHRLGVTVRYGSRVTDILRGDDGAVKGLRLGSGSVSREFLADAVIVCTGGMSYPATGSTGDGYGFAQRFGLKVTDRRPSLVPFNIREQWCKQLQGLSLKNVGLSMFKGGKVLYDGFGEMLFTHFGVSGPLVLTASCSYPRDGGDITLKIDLKPALDMEQLDARITRDLFENRNRKFVNAVSGLFPAKLTPVMVDLSGIDPDKRAGEITREERRDFASVIKGVILHPVSLRGFEEAIITRGGVDVKGIEPGTMEARGIPGLFFAGEVLDVDAVTGGYNLQIAWSTGRLAGISAAAGGCE